MADLMIKVGTYQKDGETKNKWLRLGVLRKNENGHYMLLDPTVNLAGCLLQQNAMSDQARSSVMVSVFTDQGSQKPQSTGQQSAPAQQPQQGGNDSWDEDIPFD